jgi:hypothetical protein
MWEIAFSTHQNAENEHQQTHKQVQNWRFLNILSFRIVSLWGKKNYEWKRILRWKNTEPEYGNWESEFALNIEADVSNKHGKMQA